MKTAVIYSGQTRTFAQVARNQYWHVLRKLPNPEFFVSVAPDAQCNDMQILRELFPEAPIHVEYVAQPAIPEPPDDPKFYNIYPRDQATVQDVLKQLWSLNRAWGFYRDQGIGTHDLVVRIRPDLSFGRFVLPPRTVSRGCWTPYWARWGGINDRLAVMGRFAAEEYFRTFERIQDLRHEGCPLHPEQLIHASLEMGGVKIRHTLAAEFITVRLDGSFVPMSLTETDKLEYSRGYAE